MGGSISVGCTSLDRERELLDAIRTGDLLQIKALTVHDPKLIDGSSIFHNSALHFAASHGHIEALSLLLELGGMSNASNYHRQTPLILACKNGKCACAEKLVEWGADVLIFDKQKGRTCLHYAARGGHVDCVRLILACAQLPAVSDTWGFTRFVNARDENGATPLHLAARGCHASIVRRLLSNGALVCATTVGTGRTGPGYASAPLHFAARGGSTECVKELLAWGADRSQRNSEGCTPFDVAMKYQNTACAALLNPQTAEPVVWPSPWKFMRDLDPDAKLLLEAALAQATDAWERKILSGHSFIANPLDSKSRQVTDDDENDSAADDEDSQLCYICFDDSCTIEVQDCGHQMCAGCTLALCCHQKPDPTIAVSAAPACPFCRRIIGRLRSTQHRLSTDDIKKHEGGKTEIDSVHKWKGQSEESSSGLMGLVTKGSFRLRSARTSRVMDLDMDGECISEQDTATESSE